MIIAIEDYGAEYIGAAVAVEGLVHESVQII